ncbi:hypothetical protein JZ751_008783 [Albula glossodonta]|uniref:Uncharacterized protein n=1 Tax=Albula glossodonta TaxID=121402 RepID=A0A8T2NZX4_9TELE|nr:hypothetical protein JZ751_008783 [Albula glossodonta]
MDSSLKKCKLSQHFLLVSYQSAVLPELSNNAVSRPSNYPCGNQSATSGNTEEEQEHRLRQNATCVTFPCTVANKPQSCPQSHPPTAQALWMLAACSLPLTVIRGIVQAFDMDLEFVFYPAFLNGEKQFHLSYYSIVFDVAACKLALNP